MRSTIPSCTKKTSRPGIVNRAFTGSGACVSLASTSAFMVHVIEATVFDAKVIVPGLGVFTGPFFVTDFTADGDMENNMEFSATFTPSDVLAFVAE